MNEKSGSEVNGRTWEINSQQGVPYSDVKMHLIDKFAT